MTSLLETLITFVGVMLILALAAQSLQEVFKGAFVVKGSTRRQALRGLLVEAGKAVGVMPTDATAVFTQVLERLRALGQRGFLRKTIRLDAVEKEELCLLIEQVNWKAVEGLAGLEDGEQRLKQIAKQVDALYALALAPVASRYKRRMRFTAVVTSAIIVWTLNADALTIFNHARANPAFRAAVGSAASTVQDLRTTAAQLTDSVRTLSDTTAVPSPDTAAVAAAQVALEATQDSIDAYVLRLARAEGDFLSGATGSRRVNDVQWWIGIAISVLLVSLGAPFWHDLLGVLFGWKNRVVAAPASTKTGEDEMNPQG